MKSLVPQRTPTLPPSGPLSAPSPALAIPSTTPPPPSPPATPLKPRQEKFCLSFVNLGNASYAAREAGYMAGSSRQQGWRLLKTARIRARIADIQAQMARDHGHRRDVLIGKLEVVYRRALENHHFAAATRAVEMQARLSASAIQPGPEQLQDPAAEPEAPATPDRGASPRCLKM